MKTSVPPTVAELEHCREELICCLSEALKVCAEAKEVQTLKGALAMIEQTIQESSPGSSGRHQAAQEKYAA
jgi:hypothetical protein